MLQFFKKLLDRSYKEELSIMPRDNEEHAYLMQSAQDNVFYDNLQQTIAWTEYIISRIEDPASINYGTVLRTINPQYEGKPFYEFGHEGDGIAATPEIPFNYSEVLDTALRIRPHTVLPQKHIASMGKILKFEIDVTTHDGAPCFETGGFIDGSDIPPMDTWFYISTKYLYCWIPAPFIYQMQHAIDVEILGSYSWLEEEDPVFNQYVFERLQLLTS
jgi:hypothetical protein